MTELSNTIELSHSADEVIRWHQHSLALDRLAAPWLTVRPVAALGTLKPNQEFNFEVKSGPWTSKVQWLFQVHEIDSHRSRLTDIVKIDSVLDATQDLKQMISYRQATLMNDLAQAKAAPLLGKTIAISGASGLVGQALSAYIQSSGGKVLRLVRQKAKSELEIEWNPENGTIDKAKLEGLDAFINLSGENISSGRWTKSLKEKIRLSRLQTTALLARSLAGLNQRPKLFICASAIGYYGSRGDQTLGEESPPGAGFLADVCRDWEAACQPTREAKIPTVNLRIGVVLSPKGGALQKMLTPFRLGLGATLGPGTQWTSWITIDDLVYMMAFVINKLNLDGPMNAVSPQPATFGGFCKALARVLGRPMGPKVPSWILRFGAGELADALLLASLRVVPARASREGFLFTQPDLDEALKHLLGKRIF